MIANLYFWLMTSESKVGRMAVESETSASNTSFILLCCNIMSGRSTIATCIMYLSAICCMAWSTGTKSAPLSGFTGEEVGYIASKNLKKIVKELINLF